MTFHHRLSAPRIIAPGGPVSAALRVLRKTVTKPAASGPVVEALRTMRAADPAFDLNPDLRALRRALADRIEADLAALDALGGDADLEDGAEDEPSLCGMTVAWPHNGGDDREHDEDELTGIGDHDGLIEQGYGITRAFA